MKEKFKVIIVLIFLLGFLHRPHAGFGQNSGVLVLSGEFSIKEPFFIFTPRADYLNFFTVAYENPREAHVSGKIYDLRGALVAEMEKGGTATVGDRSGSLVWDGKDSSGRYVSGGVYIYQIEVSGSESRIVNGTVVVAR